MINIEVIMKVLRYVLFILVVSCGNNNEGTQIIVPTSLPPAIEIPPTSITSTTTTTVVTYDGCIPEDNQDINFNDLKNVQNFLNRYGFDAGTEDGLSGNQTREAIKRFQAYVGITVDGDLGLTTYGKMNSYTGCEERISEYISSSTSTTILSEENISESTTTTTTIPLATTTTVIATTFEYGFQGMVSPESGNFVDILTTQNESNSFCSNIAPAYSEQNQRSDLGFPNIYNLYPSPPLLSLGASTQISLNTSSSFTIEVNGNGDENFKFYFIEPFTSSYKSLVPTSISSSPGITQATFSKDGLTQGYWFYGYADNGVGGLIKADGLREFLVGPAIVQNDINMNSFNKVWLHTEDDLISNGEYVVNNTEMYITYIMDTGFNSFSTISNEVDRLNNTLTVVSSDNYGVGDVILIDNELMLIEEISNQTFTVQRGFRNSLPQIHGIGTSVQKLVTDSDMKAVRGYAIFKGEKGYSFSVSLGKEGVPTKFTISDSCPRDLYSLDLIKVYAWREKGESTSKSVNLGGASAITSNDKFTLYQGIQDYIFPDMFAVDPSSGQFLNLGPREEFYTIGDTINFDFAGIVSGSNEIKFIELEFDMFPIGSKPTSSRKIIFTPDNNKYKFTSYIETLSDNPAFTNNVWETGYRYVLSYVKVNDGVSELIFKNNSELENVTIGSVSAHDVYYLDQFTFTINSR
jgi:peptidoglycan hydrolase-like protein with peptidoglycan-binding domain